METGDQVTAGRDVPGHVGDDRCLGTRLDEDHHVARHHDDVELPPDVDRREIRLDPLEVRCLEAGVADHRRVEIDADDVDAARRQFDRDPARTAAGIEHGAGVEPAHQVSFAMDRLALGGEGAPPRVVVVAPGELFARPPPRPHDVERYCRAPGAASVPGGERIQSAIWHPVVVTDISNSFEGDDPLTIIGVSFGDVTAPRSS